MDQLDQPQKFKDQLQSSNDTPTFVNVKEDRIEQNHATLGSINNMKDKNINDRKMKVARSVSQHIMIILITIITQNTISITTVIFGDSIQKGINIWNLNTRLSTTNCKCRFFGRAKSNQFTTILSKRYTNQTTKHIVVLHMGTNDVFDTEANEDLIAKSVIDIAKECIWVTYCLYLSRSGKDLLMNNFL